MREPIAPLLVPAAIGLVVWLVALAVIRTDRRPRSPEAGPPTMELRPEPPAVAGMLGHDFEVTRDALPATLIDLAARGAVELESQGGETFLSLRGRPVELLAHEERVLRHVQSLAHDGRVPCAALTTGPQDASRRWWTQFRKEVVAETQRRGLCRPVWDRTVVSAMVAALVAIGAVFWASVRFDFETIAVTPLYNVTIVVLVLAVAVAAAVVASDRQRDTERGNYVAAYWLGFRAYHETNDVIPTLPAAAVTVRGRHLAYCAALGLAAGAVRDLPLGAEDDERAWTDYGGHWRQVRVVYPRLRPGWGRRPVLALLAGTVGSVVAYNLGRAGAGLRGFDGSDNLDVLRGFDVAGNAVSLLAFVLLAWFGTQAVRALLDMVSGDRQVVGRIIRQRERPGFEFNAPKDEGGQRRFVAVDPGSGDRIGAWSVNREIYAHCAQGRVIEATVTRHLQHVRSVRPQGHH